MTSPVAITPEILRSAADILRAGGIVGFPTETYYGLAADPFNPVAVDRLFRIKKRAYSLPILVLVGGSEHLSQLVSDLPPLYRQLMESFWPGPLTLVYPARPEVPGILTGETGTIGFRHSSHATANRLIAAFGGPITATSANKSGRPAAVSAQETACIFAGELDLVLDGGETPGGSGSTLVTICEGRLCCIREGRIPFSAVQSFH